MESKNSNFFKIGFSIILLYVYLVQKILKLFVMPVLSAKLSAAILIAGVILFALNVPVLKQISIVSAFTNPF